MEKKIKKKSEPLPDLMSKMPIYGPMLAIDGWWPESAIAKNIMISKIMIVIFTVLSMYAWFFWMFVIILCLHTLEYFSENTPNKYKKKLANCKCYCE